MTSKRGLFVSISFPPKKDPECIQTARYFAYLSKRDDIEFDVITSSSPTLFMPDDEDLKAYDIGYKQKISIPITENKYVNYIIRKFFPAFLEKPDSKFTFHWRWRRVVKRIGQKPAFIYSRSFPLSSTIMAYKLWNYFNVPWILHISDPWADSPLHSWSESIRNNHQAMEERCFSAASKICLTSAETLSFYQNKYPTLKHKFHLYPNVFDPADYRENKLEWGKKLRVVYTGGLAAYRRATPVIKAIERLMQEDPQLSDRVEFIFAGPMDRLNRDIFENCKLKCVDHMGEIPFKEAAELQRSAHILLNIDNPVEDPKMAMYFPSKLLDYFMAQRKIIAITSKGSAADSILAEMNHETFSHEEIDKIKNCFKHAITEYDGRNDIYFHKNTVLKTFDAEYNANRLLDLIESL